MDPAGQTLSFGEIFDPNTTRVVNGAQVRSPFPNNTIPMSRLSPFALAIQNMFPLPNAPGLTNNYIIPAYQDWKHTTELVLQARSLPQLDHEALLVFLAAGEQRTQ